MREKVLKFLVLLTLTLCICWIGKNTESVEEVEDAPNVVDQFDSFGSR